MFNEVKVLLESQSRTCMVVGMSETWLDDMEMYTDSQKKGIHGWTVWQ